MGLDYDEIMALASKVDEEQSTYVDEVNEVKKEMEHSGLQTWRVLLRRRRGFVRGILREIFWTATHVRVPVPGYQVIFNWGTSTLTFSLFFSKPNPTRGFVRALDVPTRPNLRGAGPLV